MGEDVYGGYGWCWIRGCGMERRDAVDEWEGGLIDYV